MHTHRFFYPILFLLFLSHAARAGAGIEIQQPWVRSAPPTATVLAGYMTIYNHTDQAQILISITSPRFATVEIHQSMTNNNMMHMQPIKSLAIEPQQSKLFEPGSYHLMLIHPHQPVSKGDDIPLTLIFKDGTKITVTATVQDDTEAMPNMHH